MKEKRWLQANYNNRMNRTKRWIHLLRLQNDKRQINRTPTTVKSVTVQHSGIRLCEVVLPTNLHFQKRQRRDIMDAAGPIQLCAGQPAGADAAILLVWQGRGVGKGLLRWRYPIRSWILMNKLLLSRTSDRKKHAADTRCCDNFQTKISWRTALASL